MTTPKNNQDPDYDPLAAAAKRPSVSFKHSAKGERRTLQIQSLSREAQQANYDTGKPDFWPGETPGERGNPKMAVVFDVWDEQAGEARALWCPKPSSMLNAVAAAQTAAGPGNRIRPGGVLVVWIDGYKASNDPKKEDQKLYKAEYRPPEPTDALTSSQPATAPPSKEDPWAAPPAGDEPPF